MAGFPMHRFKGIDPREAARAMADAAGPLRGKILDTATGLGYSAIRAAETAEQVTTIELDPVAQEIARCNPWSRSLFDNPRIRQLIGDSSELVATMGDATFAAVIHDPPTVSLAGDLYAGSFYAQIRRLLKPGGRVFHYIGDPDSASGGRVTKGVVRRLYDAGFARVVPVAKAFGVVAVK
jgi:predicted methyltransferase